MYKPNMATCMRIVKVLAGCQRHLLVAGIPAYTSVSPVASRHLPVRTYAAAKTFKKDKKDDKEKEEKKEQKPIDNTGRHKPYGLTAWVPVDDVYVTRFYPKPVYETAVAVDMLKNFQTLDYTTLDQPVYINLKLDMKLEKKNPDQAKVAQENGAAFVGGADLVQRILDDEVDADFYVAVPDMISKLLPLKNKLRKKFPKNKRGSVGVDIPKMLELFKTGHEYTVEKDAVITRVGTLDMPKEQLIANMQTVVEDVCSHRPASFGHFIERAIVSSQTSEALLFKSEELVQKTPTDKEA
ncbi:large ribosomal subunit protein uL1m isoform X2 [Salmo salar]|uniref:Large ribosomal subunit protein uL1m isoform X2 n=1 Tax=Salmo salar TaxID=8030 RepID=A0A1S3PL46_SALSA|nr:39S ribosomal protein L1, mitochondrial isoform X2 [Salmo salar]|eukprot:XP_014028069.1 PREDICTED: 39S ribosomal protein L1, mitochondrial isoform X2 [Salmo salar]